MTFAATNEVHARNAATARMLPNAVITSAPVSMIARESQFARLRDYKNLRPDLQRPKIDRTQARQQPGRTGSVSMDRIDAMKVFVTAIDEGSLAGAPGC
jgi:hypothetical protein